MRWEVVLDLIIRGVVALVKICGTLAFFMAVIVGAMVLVLLVLSHGAGLGAFIGQTVLW